MSTNCMKSFCVRTMLTAIVVACSVPFRLLWEDAKMSTVFLDFYSTGCAIKIWMHYFNLTESNDRNSSNFITTFIYYYTELSFQVYNSFLGQLA